MASVSFTIPDANLADVVDCLSRRWGYDGSHLVDGVTPGTRAQFCQSYIAKFVKTEYITQKRDDAIAPIQASEASAVSSATVAASQVAIT